jgi:UDP-N-acetylmuramoyl-L-alanyl-D-glutamate--2,6-diaminopimelate ligase
VPGATADGHDFARGAVAAGAVALLVDRELADVAVPQVVVDDVRGAMGPLAAAVHGHPSRSLTVVGVTGTNGKTTTTAMLASVFAAAGIRCGVIGTLSDVRTTPEAPDLQARLARFRDEGQGAVAMEVSSHALDQRRVDGTVFAVSVFTNLTQDHLDFHGTMEAYYAAKARLFTPALSGTGIVNTDDPYGARLAAEATVPVVPYALADAADLRVGAGSCAFDWRGHGVEVPLGGTFNAMNALGAAAAAVACGIGIADVVRGLAATPPVPGRFESVDAGQPFGVVVDYAHTPDSLAKVLDAAREIVAVTGATGAQGHPSGRVIVVFGCGGDRDAAKRPVMGEVAGERADVVVITSDNPRHEDPAAIIGAVHAGLVHSPAQVHRQPDRRAAIALALGEAAPGDVVVIAGKGHEPYQEVGDVRLPFDDRAVVRELLAAGRTEQGSAPR